MASGFPFNPNYYTFGQTGIPHFYDGQLNQQCSPNQQLQLVPPSYFQPGSRLQSGQFVPVGTTAVAVSQGGQLIPVGNAQRFQPGQVIPPDTTAVIVSQVGQPLQGKEITQYPVSNTFGGQGSNIPPQNNLIQSLQGKEIIQYPVSINIGGQGLNIPSQTIQIGNQRVQLPARTVELPSQVLKGHICSGTPLINVPDVNSSMFRKSPEGVTQQIIDYCGSAVKDLRLISPSEEGNPDLQRYETYVTSQANIFSNSPQPKNMGRRETDVFEFGKECRKQYEELKPQLINQHCQ